ncbi:SIS domain-containing protein [Enterococcus sp.]|uniref:SIS domain-containing protein n=1 Tax=Enterococcus sp. TaxID=35783 RepID=UPI0025BBF305|nr:SIS domain-containing protein [Enterococcus sp.]
MSKPTMLSYILQEQETLTAALNAYPQNIDQAIAEMDLKADQWLVLGTGSSINAAKSAKYYMEKTAQIKLMIEEPYNFTHYEKIDPNLQVALGISQSGQSTSTIDALAKITNHHDVHTMAVTSIADSEITQVTTSTLDILSGRERVGYVTVGFSATVLALMLLGLRVGVKKGILSAEEEKQELAEFFQLTAKFGPAINKSVAFFETFRDDFKDAPRFMSIAYGPAVGTAKEMETKFSETIRVPSQGIELEAFMHGPYLEMNADYRLFFIDTPAKAEIIEKAGLLKAYEQKHTSHVFTISLRSDQSDDPYTLALGECVDEFKSPYLAIIPFQVFCWYISKEKGIDITQRIFTDFSQAVKSKTTVQDYV